MSCREKLLEEVVECINTSLAVGTMTVDDTLNVKDQRVSASSLPHHALERETGCQACDSARRPNCPYTPPATAKGIPYASCPASSDGPIICVMGIW
jgi:hypothetical protein